MSELAHGIHVAHKAYELVEKTSAGHRMKAAAVTGTVAVAKVLGGTAAASAAAAAAPLLVPMAIVGGLGYLISEAGKKR
jgi:hypothetical protein